MAAQSPGDPDEIMRKYGLGNSPSQPVPAAKGPLAQPRRRKTELTSGASGNGVFFLLVVNVALFVADHLLHLPFVKALYLNHAHWQPYQWVTHAFCHANWQHLSGNLFNLVVFGKLVEETEGAFGVTFTYVACALGAALASFLVTPAVHRGLVTVSVGASGAIFGLFSVATLTRLTWDPRRLLEAAILGQFVVRQVVGEAQAQAAGGVTMGGMQVAHVAHLGGALAGVMLVLLLRMLPADDGGGGAA